MKNRIKISVDGKSFTLVGEESEIHMKAVAAYIDEKIHQIRRSAVAVKMDTSLAYVLTALNVADDYFKEKEKNAELEGRNLGLSTRLEQLIPQVDHTKAELDEAKQELTQLRAKLEQIEKATSQGKDAEEIPQTNSNQGLSVEHNKGNNPMEHNQEMQPQHYPMGLKGGQTEKEMIRKVIREKYRKK